FAGGFHRLDQAWTQRRRRRFRRLWRLAAFTCGLLGDSRVREHWTVWERDVALARLSLDELSRDNFLDGARGALHVDPGFLLEQIDRVLALKTQQLGDFVDPDGGQKGTPYCDSSVDASSFSEAGASSVDCGSSIGAAGAAACSIFAAAMTASTVSWSKPGRA